MGDHADAPHAQQHRSPDVVGTHLVGQRRQQAERFGARRPAVGEPVQNQAHEVRRRALQRLQQHVAGEAVGDHHVGGAVEHIAAFDVAVEVDHVVRSEQLVGFFDEQVSLLGFLADRQQAHLRRLHAETDAAVRRAEARELVQPLGVAVGHGARIEQDACRAAAGHGECRGYGRACHSRQPPQPEQGRRCHRSRVAGTDHCGGLAVAHGVGGTTDRGVLLRPHRTAGLLGHLDDL